MFSGHGIPEILFSDNGPQFSRQMFASVAADYGFSHITSSPRFVQSNGEAECQVQMVKHLLSKAKDPYLAMLAHRTTPLANPAQLLMGRRLHTPIPQHHSLLIRCSSKEKGMRKKQAASYNTRHCTRQLSHLTSGQRVWITDTKTEGTVVASHSAPRSYLVESPQGTIRRNRRHLVPMPNTKPCAKIFPKTVDQTEEGEESPEPSTAQIPCYTKHDREGQWSRKKRLDL